MIEQLKYIIEQHFKNIGEEITDQHLQYAIDKFEWQKNVMEFFMKEYLGINDIDMEYMMWWFATAIEEEEDEVATYKLLFQHHIYLDGLNLFYNTTKNDG